MKDFYNISAVSYLNTKPFLFGLLQEKLDHWFKLTLDIPSVCADKLIKGHADIGLVPVAVIPSLKNPHIISDYCIGANGAVKTVALVSELPISNLSKIYLDYQSRTSVELLKILLRDYWHKDVQLLKSAPGYESRINGETGALIIGDRTIGLDRQYPYYYDLGEAWKEMTGLPFVFAAWVANKPVSSEFVKEFNAAIGLGLSNIKKVIDKIAFNHPYFSLEDYFTKYIDYNLDGPKRKALKLFLKKINMDEEQMVQFV